MMRRTRCALRTNNPKLSHPRAFALFRSDERKVAALFKKHRVGESRRGSITILSAFLMVGLLAMVAFAVDIGNICRVKTETQAVADAAALAGARGLTVSPAQVQTNAIACAADNKANGQKVVLTDSNVVLGTWSPTARTFTTLTGAAQSSANACQVNVSLTSTAGNAVTLFFAPVLGVKTENVSASAIATTGRWDVVVVLDRSSSFSADIAQALTGVQTILSDLNQYSPSSNFGMVTFDGVAYTNASLQPVGTNYSTLSTAISSIQDCANGGPPCSGSDLAAGMAGGIALFSASGYSAPTGTRKAVIFISDGAANVTSAMPQQIPERRLRIIPWRRRRRRTPTTNSGISVYSLLYFHGSDSSVDVDAMQALIQGQGTFVNEPTASQLTTDIEGMLVNGLSMSLVQ